jgi:hypothetical protein
MSVSEIEVFIRLKNAVQQKAAERLGIRKDVKDWSLNDIRDFQADLESVCKSSVSEKWFYLHFKNENEKLPRIDVLNLLSQYCGYKNWDDFKPIEPEQNAIKKQMAKWPILFFVIAIAGFSVVFWPRNEEKVVLFFDAYTQDVVPMEKVDTWFKNKAVRQKQSNLVRAVADTLFVDGAYYKPKKVFLGVADDTLRVTLYPDDFALMLNYFSRSTSDDWQKRSAQLQEAIHPEAKIFQSHPQYEGIELLNREEFIDRLILPLNSLQNLEIQDMVYKDDKIYRLRFIQKEDEKSPL